MKNSAIEAIVTIAVAIVGVATLAVLVSRNAATAQVIGAAGSAFSQSIGAAVAPVSGGGSGIGGTRLSGSFGGFSGSFGSPGMFS